MSAWNESMKTITVTQKCYPRYYSLPDFKLPDWRGIECTAWMLARKIEWVMEESRRPVDIEMVIHNFQVLIGKVCAADMLEDLAYQTLFILRDKFIWRMRDERELSQLDSEVCLNYAADLLYAWITQSESKIGLLCGNDFPERFRCFQRTQSMRRLFGVAVYDALGCAKKDARLTIKRFQLLERERDISHKLVFSPPFPRQENIPYLNLWREMDMSLAGLTCREKRIREVTAHLYGAYTAHVQCRKLLVPQEVEEATEKKTIRTDKPKETDRREEPKGPEGSDGLNYALAFGTKEGTLATMQQTHGMGMLGQPFLPNSQSVNPHFLPGTQPMMTPESPMLSSFSMGRAEVYPHSVSMSSSLATIMVQPEENTNTVGTS